MPRPAKCDSWLLRQANPFASLAHCQKALHLKMQRVGFLTVYGNLFGLQDQSGNWP